MEPYIGDEEVIRMLRRDKEINYIAFVTSSWHYLCTLASLSILQKQGKLKKGIILISEHAGAGYIIDPKLLNASISARIPKYNFKFTTLPKWGTVMRYLTSEAVPSKSEFYILRPVAPKIEFSTKLWKKNVRENIIHIVTDEGLGVYLRSYKGWMAEENIDLHSPQFWNQLQNRTWRKVFQEIMLTKKKQLLYNTFFKDVDKRIYINRACVNGLRQVLDDLHKEYDLSDYEYYSNKIVICTQTYGEEQKINNNLDIKRISDICRKAAERNIGVVIKPHPREQDLEKYSKAGAVIDTNASVPLEIVLAGLKEPPKCIVGITTTVLLTARILWNMKCFSLIRLMGKEAFKESICEEITNFERRFSDYVFIPDKISRIVD